MTRERGWETWRFHADDSSETGPCSRRLCGACLACRLADAGPWWHLAAAAAAGAFLALMAAIWLAHYWVVSIGG